MFNFKIFFIVIIVSFNLSANDSILNDNINSIRVLPEAVSNNAVTIANVKGQQTLFSFSGLAKGKAFTDIHSKAFSFNLKTNVSKTLTSLPDGKGRLASIAITVNNRVFVMGGYTVAQDHSEVSTPEVYEYYPLSNSYQLITNIPVPVDDTVALAYQNRYIYLVSGWHNDDNVTLVQVYDIQNNIWFNATPFPGAPVFGHSGGIVANEFLIVDGVKVISSKNGKRQYGASNENWHAVIDKDKPSIIRWKKIKKHPFKSLYRMGSVGLKRQNKIVFAGGSNNPYNYNGIGYNKQPSEPSAELFSYDLNQNKWLVHSPLKQASMDHRGLLVAKNKSSEIDLYLVGGMGKEQLILNRIQKITLSKFDTFNK